MIHSALSKVNGKWYYTGIILIGTLVVLIYYAGSLPVIFSNLNELLVGNASNISATNTAINTSISQKQNKEESKSILYNFKSDAFSESPSVDKEIDSMTVIPPEYLTNFKNPCWYENLTSSDVVDHNSIREYHESHGNGFIRYHFQELQRTLTKCFMQNGGFCQRLRCLPYYYIAGFSKCGTTDVYHMLSKHPDIVLSLPKEPQYWNRIRYRVLKEVSPHSPGWNEYNVTSDVPRPVKDYIDFYDHVSKIILSSTRKGKNGTAFHFKIIGDATPSYIYEFDLWKFMSANQGLSTPKYIVADIIHRLTSRAKIILILRNPTDRLFSEYFYFLRSKSKNASLFHSLAEKAISVMSLCIQKNTPRQCLYDHEMNSQTPPLRIKVGMYEPFIRDWLQVFPRGQLLITRLEDYSQNRTSVLNHITEFLGLAPFPAKYLADKDIRNQGPKNAHSMKMFPETREMIDAFYRPWNKKLALLLQDPKYLWNNTDSLV